MTKVATDASFINVAGGVGAGTVTYSSGTPATATVDPATGQVTIVTAGTTVITATKAATATHAATTATYTVTVSLAAGPAAPAAPGVTNETTAAGNDGTLTGVAAGQEYQVNGAGPWIAITGVTVTGLAPGSYTVRVAETATHAAGTATAPVTIAAF